jgi:hypothetical protein
VNDALSDWRLWISLVAAVLGALLAYERWTKMKRDRFDWLIEIAAQSARRAGEDAPGATERAKLLLGGNWKSLVWNLMRTTWIERPKADDEEHLLRFCVEARLQRGEVAKSEPKSEPKLPL